ncbi:TetR family transcriptional regulator [Kineococcus sp. R8]|uniref:TetR family transcriptional regulator n=1 Tax=Kineococcus siccus TaxID=2696567 RepID=UPI001411FA3C|nr:TetR family transcriptional regulator [Kineococcus siccus]NAZ80475.1 TetR family transcriptional regulator [Kineococcus siccus]
MVGPLKHSVHQTGEDRPPTGRAPGRPPATSAAAIASAALRLFAERGFEATTMDDVARAAGVARRTLFSYYRSKNAIVWDGEVEATDAVRTALADVAPEVGWREALVQTLPRSLRYPDDDVDLLRRRLEVIGSTPALHAHLLVEQGAAVQAVADFVTAHQDGNADPAIAHSVGHAVLAAVSAALIWWATSDEPDPREVVTRSLVTLLRTG